MTTPPPNAEVITADGSRITGLALVYDNKVVRTLALREFREADSRPTPFRTSVFDPEPYADDGEPWDDRGAHWRQ